MGRGNRPDIALMVGAHTGVGEASFAGWVDLADNKVVEQEGGAAVCRKAVELIHRQGYRAWVHSPQARVVEMQNPFVAGVAGVAGVARVKRPILRLNQALSRMVNQVDHTHKDDCKQDNLQPSRAVKRAVKLEAKKTAPGRKVRVYWSMKDEVVQNGNIHFLRYSLFGKLAYGLGLFHIGQMVAGKGERKHGGFLVLV
jgi:hypothetical protein